MLRNKYGVSAGAVTPGLIGHGSSGVGISWYHTLISCLFVDIGPYLYRWLPECSKCIFIFDCDYETTAKLVTYKRHGGYYDSYDYYNTKFEAIKEIDVEKAFFFKEDIRLKAARSGIMTNRLTSKFYSIQLQLSAAGNLACVYFVLDYVDYKLIKYFIQRVELLQAISEGCVV